MFVLFTKLISWLLCFSFFKIKARLWFTSRRKVSPRPAWNRLCSRGQQEAGMLLRPHCRVSLRPWEGLIILLLSTEKGSPSVIPYMYKQYKCMLQNTMCTGKQWANWSCRQSMWYAKPAGPFLFSVSVAVQTLAQIILRLGRLSCV